jgi:hypothetical protein
MKGERILRAIANRLGSEECLPPLRVLVMVIPGGVHVDHGLRRGMGRDVFDETFA